MSRSSVVKLYKEHQHIFTVHGINELEYYRLFKDVNTRILYDDRQRREIRDKHSEATFGFFFDLDGAQEAVHNNYCDIHEACYNYVVIEEYAPGLYNVPVSEHWYRWVCTGVGHDQGRYELIDRPKELDKLVSWGLS